MITNATIKIPVVDDLTTDYIENCFKQQKLNVIRWAIVGREDDKFILSVSVVE